MNEQKRDSFDFADEPELVSVTLRGRSKDYHFYDISKNEFDRLYEPVTAAIGDPAATKEANKTLMIDAIALVVRQTDGARISPEDVGQMRSPLINKLGMKVIAFMTGGDVKEAGEQELKVNLEGEPAKND